MDQTSTATERRTSAAKRGGTKDSGNGHRLSREDWIDGAILVLSEGNVEALEVKGLAERLGVTKGSFYWHFENREALLEAVIDTWRRRMTGEIEAFIRGRVGTPAGRLRRLIRIAMSARPDVPGGPLELALRDWARRDARVADIIREVDARRLAFLRELYKEAGLDDERAETYAFLHMSYVIGGRILLSHGTQHDLERSWRIGEDHLLPKD